MDARRLLPDATALWFANPALRRQAAIEAARRNDFRSFCRIIGYEPHAAQELVHACTSQHIVLRWGRQSGKTLAEGVRVAFDLLKPDRHGWIIGPVYEKCNEVWKYVTAILCESEPLDRHTMPDSAGLGFKPSKRRDADPRYLAFSTYPDGSMWNSDLKARSTEHGARDRLTGATLDFVIGDEWAYCPPSAWDKVQPCLGARHGWAMFSSTPNGWNHFTDLYDSAATRWEWEARRSRMEERHNPEGDPDWASFYATTEVNFERTPFMHTAWDQAKRNMSAERFAQEYEANPQSFLGQVYKEFDPEYHVRPLEYDLGLPLMLSFDFGASNPWVCLWLQWTPEGTLHIIDEYTTGEILRGEEVVSDEKRSWGTIDNGRAVLAQHEAAEYGKIDYAAGDPAGKDAINTLRKHLGINVEYYKLTKGGVDLREVPAGIERVREYMRVREDEETGEKWTRFAVDPRCKQTIFELNRYAYGETAAGRGAKEVPQKANDHACLVAGTMVSTPEGEKAIEELRAGDLVFTRGGIRRVGDWALTQKGADVYRVETSRGHGLTGTGNHPVWVEGKGFVRLDALRYGDILETSDAKEAEPCQERPSASTGTCSLGTRTLPDSQTGCTSKTTGDSFTARSGKMLTGLSRRAWSYITSTAIRAIMTSRTSVYELTRVMRQITGLPRRVRDNASRLTAFAILRHLGIVARKVGHGIASMASKWRPPLFPSPSFASGAGLHSRVSRSGRASAPTSASRLLAGPLELTTKRGPAPTAAVHSPLADMNQSGIAPVSVLGVQEWGNADVYNLTVEGEHEYYANGMLVSNCDALRYAVRLHESYHANRHSEEADRRRELYTEDGHRLRADSGVRFKSAKDRIAERHGWAIGGGAEDAEDEDGQPARSDNGPRAKTAKEKIAERHGWASGDR